MALARHIVAGHALVLPVRQTIDLSDAGRRQLRLGQLCGEAVLIGAPFALRAVEPKACR